MTIIRSLRMWLNRSIGNAKILLRFLIKRRSRPITCPCCKVTTSFGFYGIPLRPNARCPNCFSLERHRLLTLYFERTPELGVTKNVLHFAPEKIIKQYLKAQAISYTGCDLYPTAPDDVKANVEQLYFDDSCFDLIICSHVLEFVDDRKALLELYRVLKRDGLLILMFPIVEGWDSTFEDSTIHKPADRFDFFGDRGHVRVYGQDVRKRIQAAGFKLSEYTAEEPDASTFGLLRGEKLFLCRK